MDGKDRQMELLQKKNIIINCKAKEKEAIIREIGQILCDSGYVEAGYIDGMLERENSFSTNIGNQIAIPHGVEASKSKIRSSGIAVMVFPEGTLWNDEKVSIVIGIAAKGEEHLDILANIANKLATEEAVVEMLHSSVDEVYRIFTDK